MNNFSTSASSDISTSFSSLLSTSGIGNATDDILFAETFLSDNHEPVVHNTATPTLIEAILEPDNFLVSTVQVDGRIKRSVMIMLLLEELWHF